MSESTARKHDSPTLRQLLEQGAVWQGARPTCDGPRLSSGLMALDRLLEGGWPATGLVEVLHERQGQGEVELLLPLLGRQSREGLPVFVVSPPGRPCATGWQQGGVALERLWFLLTSRPEESLWALEQLASHPQPLLALAWVNQASFAQLRRLQLAATETGKLLFLLRDTRKGSQPSPARLRLAVSRDDQGRIQPRILRHRTGQGGSNPWRRAG